MTCCCQPAVSHFPELPLALPWCPRFSMPDSGPFQLLQVQACPVQKAPALWTSLLATVH